MKCPYCSETIDINEIKFQAYRFDTKALTLRGTKSGAFFAMCPKCDKILPK